jgi:hypoxanthine-DNA glycosylase
MTDVPLQHCFPPVVGPGTRLLILGSLPGAMSLAASRYYANPRNQFWRLVEAVIERPLEPLAYQSRLEALQAAGIGLWDTVASAQRPGSLDMNIKLHEASDLAGLVKQLPSLRALAFNGGTSARIGRRQIDATEGIALLDLPSSSPAYTLAFEAKRTAWLAMREYL